MIVLLAVLVGSAVLLWPRGRAPSPFRACTGIRHGRSSDSGAAAAAGEGAVLARVRGVLRPELRFGRARRTWVADFAELAAVGLDAGLPSAEAARLACAVDASPGHPRSRPLGEARALGEALAAAEASGAGVGSCLADAAGEDPDLALLAAAWQLTDEFGVAAAPAARTAAEVLRERAAADDRRAVLAAGPRASMWLLTLLPLSGPFVALLLGLPVTEVYGGAPAMVAATVGLVLTCLGWSWSRALLRRALRPARVR